MDAPAYRFTTERGWRYAFTGVLAMTMAVAIFINPVMGILARFLIDDLGLTRTEVGWVAAVTSLSGALLGPHAGRYADRLGGRRMLIIVFTVSAAAYIAMSTAPTLGFLFVGAFIAGVAQSGANPATNKLIGLHVPPGRRGITTGIKQSGVQVAIFFGGIVMPAAAIAWGWRVALSLTTVVALAGLIATLIIVPRDQPIPPSVRSRKRVKAPLPEGIKWIAADGVLNGLVVAATVIYLPLYAEESAGMGVAMAGLVASVYAIAGLLSRISSAHFSERAKHFSRPLLLIAWLSTAGVGMLWLAQAAGPWLVWVGAFVLATGQAFNAVAFVAVISSVDQHDAGRASGIVARGFGIGTAIGPPLFGFTVDSTGGYGLGFAILIGFGTAAAALMVIWGRRDRDRSGRRLS